MLNWALLFLILAIISGVFAFAAVAGAAVFVAKVMFLVYTALFLISALVLCFQKPRDR